MTEFMETEFSWEIKIHDLKPGIKLESPLFAHCETHHKQFKLFVRRQDEKNSTLAVGFETLLDEKKLVTNIEIRLLDVSGTTKMRRTSCLHSSVSTRTEFPKLLSYDDFEKVFGTKNDLKIVCTVASSIVHPRPKSDFLKDLEPLYMNKTNADYFLFVDKKSFAVHRFLLDARSELLSQVLPVNPAVQMAPSFLAGLLPVLGSKDVHVKGVSEQVLEEFLTFVYKDELPQLADLAEELLAFAHRTKTPSLKKRCETYLKYNISTDDCCSLLKLGHDCDAKLLKERAVDFIVRHIAEVKTKSTWEPFIQENPSLLVEVFNQLKVS